MDPKHAPLYRRIMAFPIDDEGVELTFAARLARENGWDRAYAERVILEYKRFVFLAMTAGHPVTPSEQVDQAWHLHLTYTRSYWERFCGELLGRPLHHVPTKGGADEGRKHVDQYVQTLDTYREVFGKEPPADVWPDADTRFGDDLHARRVNTGDHWVVPKRWLPRTGFALVAGVSGGLWVASGFEPLNLPGPVALLFFLTATGVVFGTAAFVRRRLRHPDDEPGPKELDLDPYEAAYLAGGSGAAVNAAAAALYAQGVVQPGDRGRLRLVGEVPGDLHPLERAVAEAADGDSSKGVRVPAVRSTAARAADRMGERLKELGLLVGDGAALQGRLFPLLIALSIPLWGLEKIVVGVSRHKPVTILVILTALVTAAALIGFARRPHRSLRGDRALGQLQRRFARLRTPGTAANAPTPDLTMGVALFGTAILADGSMADLHKTLAPPSSGGSGCSGGGGCGGGGGGCGGGGCGGGCGGCGG
jgi:uncharacterized protein (TIGR04222 family)